MHFTVVFEGTEASDLSYGLVFVPGPVWVRSDEQLVNRSHKPRYAAGDLEALLVSERIESRLGSGARNATVVVHGAGHGSEADLGSLLLELADLGFTAQQVGTLK
jgi:hypothetical protein